MITLNSPMQYNFAQRHAHSLKFLNYMVTYYFSQVAQNNPFLKMTQSFVAGTFLPDVRKHRSVPGFTKLPFKTDLTGLSSPRKLGEKKLFPSF